MSTNNNSNNPNTDDANEIKEYNKEIERKIWTIAATFIFINSMTYLDGWTLLF